MGIEEEEGCVRLCEIYGSGERRFVVGLDSGGGICKSATDDTEDNFRGNSAVFC